MLKSRDKDLHIEREGEGEDFKIFTSQKEPYFRLIKYKGIGYDENNKPEDITKKTVDYITKQDAEGNHNNFVHCIWYCITGNGIEDIEIQYLKKLKKAFPDIYIPIIIVYIKGKIPEKMKKIIKDQLELDSNNYDSFFVNVIPKPIRRPDKTIINVKGDNTLRNTTIDKINEALKGNMQKIMIEKFKKEINNSIKKQNSEIKKQINNLNITNFITGFKTVMNDLQFINYLIDIFGRNLYSFFSEHNNISNMTHITNNSLNLIINSTMIKTVKEMMQFYKLQVKNIIKNFVSQKAEEFIDIQVNIEKDKKKNIQIKNKRTLKQFQKTTEVFLKHNFYYVWQKYIVYYILEFCQKENSYLDEFEKNLNSLIQIIFERDDIMHRFRDLLRRKTEELQDLNISEINKSSFIIEDGIKENHVKLTEEKLNLNEKELKNRSFELDLNTIEEYHIENEEISLSFFNNLSDLFLSVKKNGKYLGEDLSNKLYNYLNKFEYQEDTIFDINDSLFMSLVKYIKTDLKLFCKNNQKNFIHILNNYSQNQLKKNIFDRSSVLNENGKMIYFEKIKKKFNDLKDNDSFLEINYITIILTGKSRIGKSTLINAILKEDLAKTDEAQVCTVKRGLYSNKKIPYFRMIDTRGIELIEKYGIENIFKDINEICQDPTIVSKSWLSFKCFTNLPYKDNIQCIWYCVSDYNLEKKEIELIKGLNKGQDILPIIFVYTKSYDQDDINKKEQILKEKYPNIPFHSVLAFDKEDLKSFGVEELIYITIDQCKKAFRGKLFGGIKNDITNEIIKHFEKENRKIVFQANKKIALHFINSYNTLLDEDKFKKYIYDLLEMIVISLLKIQKNQEMNLKSKIIKESFISLLSGYINTYINYYKKEAKNLIDLIKDKKAINYLNAQVIIEKSNKTNLGICRKFNESEFINIITQNLQKNIYYISQKYFIYQFIIEFGDFFSDKVLKEFNGVMLTILKEPQTEKFYQDIYQNKYEMLEQKVKKSYKETEYEKVIYENDNKNDACALCNII